MASYSGSIGTVNVLDFASTEIFDDTQENPFLLKQHNATHVVPTVNVSLCAKSVSPRKQTVTFGALPLGDLNSFAPPSPRMESIAQPPSPSPVPTHSPVQRSVSMVNPAVYSPTSTMTWSNSKSPEPNSNRASLAPSYLSFNRQERSISNASTDDTVMDRERTDSVQESDLHKLLYTLARLGVGEITDGTELQPDSPSSQSQTYDYEQGIMTAPTSPVRSYNALWRSASEAPESPSRMEVQDRQLHFTEPSAAQLQFRSRRMSKRKGGRSRSLSAPSSPISRDDYNTPAADDNSLSTRPRSTSQGSVTFTTVKNLLRGGGSLARTVHRESRQRPRCLGADHTLSTKRKQRQKFQRPTVITDARHRVSTMKLGTSPMKSKCKHTAFPGFSSIDSAGCYNITESDPGMPSPKHLLHHHSLIPIETLDMIGTRHASPVHLIEHPLPDYSNVPARVDTWNDCKKPKRNVRLPSAWLIEITKSN